MDKRLNYRKLLNHWMQFYSLSAETSKKMFAAIWARMQASIGHMPCGKTGKEGVMNHETYVERSGRTGKKE